MVLARHRGDYVAAALSLRSDDALYGRYWGASEQFHSLHFEACYYSGVDYCISHGLARFEPGAQGEHKISRGFAPTATYSAHWLRDPRFDKAIARHLDEERRHMRYHKMEMSTHLPYKSADDAATIQGGDRCSGWTPMMTVRRFRTWSVRCANRTACSRPAAIYRPAACRMPIVTASFLGTARTNRYSGGRPIRVRSCIRNACMSRAACARPCARASMRCVSIARFATSSRSAPSRAATVSAPGSPRR